MDRDRMLARVRQRAEPWDLLVVGGGATGLGVAVEAAARGYDTLLVEQSDFAKGTSSRSTKLIHGGVRYLRQGNVALVMEALRERGRLIRNAPHLVHDREFVVPTYDWWEGPFYGIGLKLYDALAGQLGLGPSLRLSRDETLERIPTLEPEGLRGGIVYHDGQFDDARLAVTLARTFVELGGTALNYLRVTGLVHEDGLVAGAVAEDLDPAAPPEARPEPIELRARVVVNATGPFADSVRHMDDPDAAPLLTHSQGVHVVLDRSFLPGDSAILVPETADGRVLFAVPWHDRIVVGTTDTPVEEAELEPRPFDAEIDYLLEHAARYLVHDPTRDDVLSCFAGLRPLLGGGRGAGGNGDASAEDIAPNDGGGPDGAEAAATAELSREHAVVISASDLVTVAGGKWTTYRAMGADAVDRAAELARLPRRQSPTRDLRLHGYTEADVPEPWDVYGSEADEVRRLGREVADCGDPLHPSLPYSGCEVVWAVRHEMARSVEDVLSRRTRALLLDARAAVEAAPAVARLMAAELGRDEEWAERQAEEFAELAARYLPDGVR